MPDLGEWDRESVSSKAKLVSILGPSSCFPRRKYIHQKPHVRMFTAVCFLISKATKQKALRALQNNRDLTACSALVTSRFSTIITCKLFTAS